MAPAVPVHEGLPPSRPHAAGEAVAARGGGDSKRGALPRTERVDDEERGEAEHAPLVKPPPLTFRARGWGACCRHASCWYRRRLLGRADA